MSLAAFDRKRVPRPTGKAWRRKMFDALVVRDGGHCAECKAPDQRRWRRGGASSNYIFGGSSVAVYCTLVYLMSNLEVDHKLPLSDGGDNELANLWLLCTDCHKRKTSQERSKRLKRLFAEARA